MASSNRRAMILLLMAFRHGAVGLAAFTLQMLMDQSPPAERHRAAAPRLVPA